MLSCERLLENLVPVAGMNEVCASVGHLLAYLTNDVLDYQHLIATQHMFTPLLLLNHLTFTKSIHIRVR